MTETASNGRYRIESVLGRGGFGTVFRSRFEGEGGFSKEVALKVLDPDALAGEEVARRLRDEARILGMLRHPSIVQVDRLVCLEGRWAVVMELIDGVDLARLGSLVPLPVGIVLQVAAEVAGALHAAWSSPGPTGAPLQLLHRDIKPSNVLVTAHGVVKVLDFGVAKAEFETREATSGRFIFGSPDYMAPERFEGADSPAGDVYALGVLIVQALTGRTMGRAAADPDQHQATLDAQLAPIAEQLGEQLGLVAELLGVFLAFDPTERPTAADCEDALRALAEHAGGPPLRVWASQEVAPLSAELWAEASAAAREANLTDTILTEDIPSTDPTPSLSDSLPSAVWPDLPPDDPATADTATDRPATDEVQAEYPDAPDSLLPGDAAGPLPTLMGAAAAEAAAAEDDEDVEDDPTNPPNVLAAALGMVDEPIEEMSDEVVWDNHTLSQTPGSKTPVSASVAMATDPGVRRAAVAAARSTPLVAPKKRSPRQLKAIVASAVVGLLVFAGVVALLTPGSTPAEVVDDRKYTDLPLAPGIGDLVRDVDVDEAMSGSKTGKDPAATTAAVAGSKATATLRSAPPTIKVTGDADKVYLVSPTTVYALPGPVPPGTWRIEANFPGESRSAHGSVLLTEGAAATIHCSVDTASCTML